MYILLLVICAFNKQTKKEPEDGLVDRNWLPKKKLIIKCKLCKTVIVYTYYYEHIFS